MSRSKLSLTDFRMRFRKAQDWDWESGMIERQKHIDSWLELTSVCGTLKKNQTPNRQEKMKKDGSGWQCKNERGPSKEAGDIVRENESRKTARAGVRLLGNLRYEERQRRQQNQWTCLCVREWSPGSMPSSPQSSWSSVNQTEHANSSPPRDQGYSQGASKGGEEVPRNSKSARAVANT